MWEVVTLHHHAPYAILEYVVSYQYSLIWCQYRTPYYFVCQSSCHTLVLLLALALRYVCVQQL